MTKANEAVKLLMSGFPPHRISRKLGTSVNVVMNILYRAVGEGEIRRSDIALSYPKTFRAKADKLVDEHGRPFPFGVYAHVLGKNDTNEMRKSLHAYLFLRDACVAFGDMYDYLRGIESTLHKAIRNVLLSEYGEPDWWRKGVPTPIRTVCAPLYENDTDPAPHQYCYTTFIQLHTILDKRWDLFLNAIVEPKRVSKRVLLRSLTRLNGIRNSVMHPVRGVDPSESDFLFVREFHKMLREQGWTMLARP